MSKHRKGKNNPPDFPRRPAQERIRELEESREGWIEAYIRKANELDEISDEFTKVVDEYHRLADRYYRLLNSITEVIEGPDPEIPQIVTDHPPVHNHGPEEGPGLACREYRDDNGHLRGTCLDGEIPIPIHTGDCFIQLNDCPVSTRKGLLYGKCITG